MTLTELVPSLREYVAEVALHYGKPDELILAWWERYRRDCLLHDRSPVMSEFEEWYRVRLECELDEYGQFPEPDEFDEEAEPFRLDATPAPRKIEPLRFPAPSRRQRELWPGCHADLPGQGELFQNYGREENDA